jgi:hypothetical protein
LPTYSHLHHPYSLPHAANQNKRGSNSQVHETHAAFNKPNNRTPAELSRLKAEKDRREYEEYQQRKKQEDDIMRKHRTQMEVMKQQVGLPLRGRSYLGSHGGGVPFAG